MNFFGEVVSVVGHRGWPARWPDNTLAGFAEAFTTVAMVETDVRRAAGGELLLSHDPELGGHLVSVTDWSVLREVDIDGQAPALLDDALAAFPDGRWNLEIKNDPLEPGFEEDLGIAVETAERAGPGDLITSFYWPNVDVVRVRFPELRTGLLVDRGWDVDPAIDHALERGHVVIAAHWTQLDADPGLVERLGLAGLAAVAWTVNDVDVARRLDSAGVAAIITDDPGLMVEALL